MVGAGRWGADFLLKCAANAPASMVAAVGDPDKDHQFWDVAPLQVDVITRDSRKAVNVRPLLSLDLWCFDSRRHVDASPLQTLSPCTWFCALPCGGHSWREAGMLHSWHKCFFSHDFQPLPYPGHYPHPGHEGHGAGRTVAANQ